MFGSNWRTGRLGLSATTLIVLVLAILVTGCTTASKESAGKATAASVQVDANVPQDVAVALESEMKKNLDAFTSAGKPENERLKAYRIDHIEVMPNQASVYKVTYSVQPVAPVTGSGTVATFWVAASGKVENGWVVGKVKMIKVIKDGSSFRFEDGLG